MFIPQLANTVTGGAVDRYLWRPATAAIDRAFGGTGQGSTLAESSQDTRDALDTLKSPQLRQQEQELADTKGFLPSAKAILTHPALLEQQVAEQLPQFIAPAGIVRKAGAVALERAAGEALAKGAAKRVATGMTEEAAQEAAAKAAARIGQRAAVKAGAKAAVATEAAQSASQNSEQAQQQVMGMDQATLDQNPDYQAAIANGATPQQAREQLAMRAGERAAAAGAALTAATGGLTAGLESRIFQGETGVNGVRALLSRTGAKETAKAVGKEFAQEALQEGGEQLGQNWGVQSADPNQSLWDQVPEQAALGGVIGGVMGGGAFAASSAAQSRLRHPRFAGAAPGSLSDAANTIDASAGPISRAAAAAAPAPAPVAAAEPLAAAKAEWDQTMRAAGPNGADPQALAEQIAQKHGVTADAILHTPDVPATPRNNARVDPGAPPWLDPATGEVQPPTKDQLLSALADHLVRQYSASGDMRVDNGAIARAWGVPRSKLDQLKKQAITIANDQVAAAERAAMGQGGATQAPVPSAPAGGGSTTASMPVMITQAMKTELRALGHTDADIAKMTPQQAHDVLRAGEPILADARDLNGNQGGPAVDQAIADQQQAAEQAAQESSRGTTENGAAGPAAAAESGSGGPNAGEANAQPAEAGGGSVPSASEPQQPVRAAVPGTDAGGQPNDQLSKPSGKPAPAGQPSAYARAAETVRVKLPDGGSINGRTHVDRAVADGYTKVESVRAGDRMVHALVNDAGDRVPLLARQLKYAQEITGQIPENPTTTAAAPATTKTTAKNNQNDNRGADAPAAAPTESAKETLTPAQQRTARLLGAGPGDTVRTTGFGRDIQPGSIWKIERIDADGTVHITVPGGGNGSFTNKELGREVKAGATFEKATEKRSQVPSPSAAPARTAVAEKAAEPPPSTAESPARESSIEDRSQETPPAGGVSASKGGTELERRTIPQYNPLRPAEGITNRLYRETNAEGVSDLLDGMDYGSGPGGRNVVYAASHEHLAKGQGSNKGVLVELDPAGFDGRLDLRKPAARQLVQTAGEAELEIAPKRTADSRNFIRSVTLKPGWKVGQNTGYTNRVLLRLRQLQAKGWLKTKTNAGITFRPPPALAPMELAPADLADKPVNLADKVEAAAAEAASSPANDLPEPTDAQKEAGNYSKGHVSIQGLDISIENPRGSVRSGTDANGKTWSHEMSDHYGYIRRTSGGDGEQIDVYVGPKPESEKVYVVDQIHQDSGKFDEHKAMIGFDSEKQAVDAYRLNFDKGWKVGPVHAMSMDEFKGWLKEGDTSRPVSEAPAHLFSFAGEKAQTADRAALDQAKQMEAMGRESVPDRNGNQPGSPEDTHLATGWHRGVDGKWRFEIDDSQARIKTDALKDIVAKRASIEDLIQQRRVAFAAGDTAAVSELKDRIREANQAYEEKREPRMDQVLDHPALYAAYPDLANIRVHVDPELSSWGSYNSRTGDITIRPPSAYPESGNRSLKSVVLHEVQHAIQEHEGFARGGSAAEARTLPEYEQLLKQYMAEHGDALPDWTRVIPSDEAVQDRAAHEVYRRLAGEVEARNTQTRLGMTAEERRAMPPTETADTARGEQVVRFNGERANDAGESAPISPAERAHAAKLRKAAELAVGRWKGDDVPRLRVVATPEELPAYAKRGADGEPDDSYRRAAGMYDGHTIWVVASAHQGPEGLRKMLTTIAHEGVGHYGIDRIVTRELGASAWAKITAATERLRADPALASPSMRAVLDDVASRYGTDVDANTHARETLAVMAERGVRNGLMDRAVTALRRWLRRVLPNLKLSERELRQLLVRSSEYLERGATYDQRVQAQAAMAFSRDGWAADFPDVVTAHRPGFVRDHADYAAAKAGDSEAALRLARDAVTPDFVQRVREAIPEGSKPIIVPVVAREATGNNRIPDAAAEVLAHQLGTTVDHDLIQAEKVGRGGADAMHRLANQPTFDGPVKAGQDYVLLDDTLAQGGTLAQLKTHIERGGGRVVLATALTGKDYSRKLALDSETLGQVRERFGRIEGWWRRHFGYGFDGLTESEARTILTYNGGRLSPDALRDRILARRIPGLRSVGEGAAGEGSGAEAPGTGGRQRDFSLNAPAGEEPAPRRNSNFQNASASIEAIGEQLPKLDESALQRAKDWIAGKARDFEPAALGALQLRHVLELAEGTKVLAKPAKAYAELFQRMDGDRNTLTQNGAAKVDGLVKWARQHGLAGWAGKLKPEAHALFKFMHAVTQLGIDPTSEYQRLLMTDSRGEQMPWTEELRRERIAALRGQMRGRPGDDKQVMQDQIKDLQRLPAREKARKQKYPELVAAWNALTPEAREQFAVMRDHYREQSEALEQAAIDHIESLDIPAQSKRAAITTIQQNFSDAKVNGVYFPLMRFGDYWVSAHTADGEYVFAKYESSAEQVRAERQLVAAGGTIEATGRQDNNYRSKDAPSGTFMGDLMGVLRAAKAPEAVQDQIYQMFLKTLPELSLRKRGIHRKNIAGYTDDVPRAFASSVFHGAHQLSKARYGWQLQNTLEHMRGTLEALRGGMSPTETSHADALVGEINRRHDWILNPTNSKLANMINSVGFAYFIAASPASALVNLIQVPQIVLPVLGGQHGWGRATRVLTRTMRDAFRTGGNIDRVLTGEDLQAYKALQNQGTFQRTATHALAGLAEGDNLRSSPAYARVLNAVSAMFHVSEVINREGTGIAAFRLAREKGMSFNEAVKYADEITNGTHGDYSNANRARYLQGNVAKVLGQFKSYSLAMSWLWGRQFYKAFKGETPEVRATARRTVTGMLGMTGLFAGVVGMPIFNVLRYAAQAVHAATGDDDEPWDFMTEFRAWLTEHLGETAASVIADGPVNQLGLNVASRVSMSDLWFRESDRQLEGEDAYNDMLQSIAGPFGGLIKNMYIGAQQFNEGHTWRGIETMLPTAAKNTMKAVRYAKEGVNTLRGDPIVPDINAAQDLVQALGFQPTEVAEQQRINNALYNYSDFVKERRQSLVNAFAMATQSGDADGRADALQAIQAFNAKYPEVAIRMGNLHASLRQRARISAESEHGVRLDRRLAGRVRQEVGAPAD